jgi:hypothetical protein
MFNRGVDELLRALPQLGNLDPELIRRLLTRAWVDVVDAKDLGGTADETNLALARFTQLRRLATALEVHAILPARTDPVTVQACAFVAAEALDVVAAARQADLTDQPWLFGRESRFVRVEAALLYAVAGNDANASRIADSIGPLPADVISGNETTVSEWTLRAITRLLRLRGGDVGPPPPGPAVDDSLEARARHAVWELLGEAAHQHLVWLTGGFDTDERIAQQTLDVLIASLHGNYTPAGQPAPARHGDLHHLALLLRAAIRETGSRALRLIQTPPSDGGRFRDYQRRRATDRPLLWPGALHYAEQALPGPWCHAVVSVPTGAGKSAVAELAIAQCGHRGWALYLAPTNTLVAQIRRGLAEGRPPGSGHRVSCGCGYQYSAIICAGKVPPVPVLVVDR